MKLFSRLSPLVLVAVLAGCSSDATPEVTPAPETPEPSATPVSNESESPTPEPTEDPSPSPEPVTGSRESPMGIGDTRQLSDASAFTVGITESNLDATAQMAQDDPYCERPPEGERYVTATVEATVSEAELAEQGFDLQNDGAEPYMSIFVEFVGGDGRGYSALDAMCIPDDSFLESGTVYEDGGTVSGVDGVVVPDDAVEGGLWRLSNSTGDSVWIEAE